MIEIPNRCIPCSRYTLTVTPEEAGYWQSQVPKWNLSHDAKFLSSTLPFPSFEEACRFLADKLAPLCAREDHHPTVEINFALPPYPRTAVSVEVTFHTYFRGPRLTMNDFVMAKLVDKLAEES